jgi:hypothetical protein
MLLDAPIPIGIYGIRAKESKKQGGGVLDLHPDS